jgi:hypothetical protein
LRTDFIAVRIVVRVVSSVSTKPKLCLLGRPGKSGLEDGREHHVQDLHHQERGNGRRAHPVLVQHRILQLLGALGSAVHALVITAQEILPNRQTESSHYMKKVDLILLRLEIIFWLLFIVFLGLFCNFVLLGTLKGKV